MLFQRDQALLNSIGGGFSAVADLQPQAGTTRNEVRQALQPMRLHTLRNYC